MRRSGIPSIWWVMPTRLAMATPCMTTHGRSGVGRLIFGSVAVSVLRGTTIPIFLRRPSDAPVDLPAVSTQPKEVLR